jgi:hypothetical protein
MTTVALVPFDIENVAEPRTEIPLRTVSGRRNVNEPRQTFLVQLSLIGIEEPVSVSEDERMAIVGVSSAGGGVVFGSATLRSRFSGDVSFPSESVAITLNPQVPEYPMVAGLPVIVPDGNSVKPGGSAPELSVHVYGAWPPVAVSVA